MKLDSRLVSFFTIALITIVMACSNSKTMDEDRKENDGNKTPTPSAQLAKWEPITFEQADTIIDNYRENFRPRFEARNDTTYKRRQTDHVWTSIDSLKTFLNAIEKESVDKNKIALSGVRFYFAAYKNAGRIPRP